MKYSFLIIFELVGAAVVMMGGLFFFEIKKGQPVRNGLPFLLSQPNRLPNPSGHKGYHTLPELVVRVGRVSHRLGKRYP